VVFVVDKVALGQVFSEYGSVFQFALQIAPQSSSSSSAIIWDWYNKPNSGRGRSTNWTQVSRHEKNSNNNKKDWEPAPITCVTVYGSNKFYTLFVLGLNYLELLFY
jgi:hypothetical protein